VHCAAIDILKEMNENIVEKLDLQHTRPATKIPLYDDGKKLLWSITVNNTKSIAVDDELVFIPGPKKEDNVSLYRVSKDQLLHSLIECCESLG